MNKRLWLVSYLLLCILATACSNQITASSPAQATAAVSNSGDPASALTLPPGYHAELITDQLSAPTHIALDPDGVLYLTQLNGGENDGKGQVVRLTTPGSAPEVVIDGLVKPTGLTWAAGNLYIVAGNNVLISKVHDGKFDPPTALFKDLPFNGRSEGQIFTGPDGLLYFQSTGNENIPTQSGFIYIAKPDGSEQKVYARGFKNAYAMAWDAKSGQMYATEIGDGEIQGVGTFPEELNLIHRGGDYGWPLCYANQQENHGLGGNRNICADTDGVIALFPPHNTPTGLAVFDDKLIVALWGGTPPRLVSVDPTNGSVTDYASGFKRPIALLVQPDGSLLIVDIDGNALWRLVKNVS
ncbi:MAG: PQQ-dependent sugar dehydrogenase [Chloroflexota bacterium]